MEVRIEKYIAFSELAYDCFGSPISRRNCRVETGKPIASQNIFFVLLLIQGSDFAVRVLFNLHFVHVVTLNDLYCAVKLRKCY
ncbi:hypothetical protein SIDU_08415 [Sphingobium indicum B90A]|uniref:Uncharacterized protein n=1 Tax=Sphingobium indicum (strain DSM 16412 / CCM 7286 / MTCC 6364 / B90A) TaxID=861109 RepID=A0A1L5BNR6_SPHIB|nr:hypothetical protein SIDU_08415 [Sphingobium indicum B90A]